MNYSYKFEYLDEFGDFRKEIVGVENKEVQQAIDKFEDNFDYTNILAIDFVGGLT